MQYNTEEIRKLILFRGDIETLGYFSEQMVPTFTELGYQVFLFDFEQERRSIEQLHRFLQDGRCAMITFNFTGLNGRELFQWNAQYTIWDWYDVLCVNIMVDHPFYYHVGLEAPPKHFMLFCIDRLHMQYVKRFFPEIKEVHFLPLAGTSRPAYTLPYEKRTCNLVFTGNYTPPATFEQYITRINEEYTGFYHRILDDLIAHPATPIDEAIEKHLRLELDEEVTEEVIKQAMPEMIFLDLYIRFYYRGKVVQTLVDHGQKVHVYGGGWEKLDCHHRENLILGGGLDSDGCLKQIGQAKLSLNVMPWFKDGAHDRIFNSMLNRAVCITDESKYLREHFTDGKEVLYYSLEKIEDLPSQIEGILADKQRMQEMKEAGYQAAVTKHTWRERAEALHRLIKEC